MLKCMSFFGIASHHITFLLMLSDWVTICICSYQEYRTFTPTNVTIFILTAGTLSSSTIGYKYLHVKFPKFHWFLPAFRVAPKSNECRCLDVDYQNLAQSSGEGIYVNCSTYTIVVFFRSQPNWPDQMLYWYHVFPNFMSVIFGTQIFVYWTRAFPVGLTQFWESTISLSIGTR